MVKENNLASKETLNSDQFACSFSINFFTFATQSISSVYAAFMRTSKMYIVAALFYTKTTLWFFHFEDFILLYN